MGKALYRFTPLLGCPVCKAQMIEEKVQGYNDQDWKNLHQLHRKVRIPAEVDLVPVFQGWGRGWWSGCRWLLRLGRWWRASRLPSYG